LDVIVFRRGRGTGLSGAEGSSAAFFLLLGEKIVGTQSCVLLGFSRQDMSGTGMPRSQQRR
jgi:hypothetical protein